MKVSSLVRRSMRAGAFALLAWSAAAFGQAFNSGSTGADGAFTAPTGTTTITVREGGVYHYTTFSVPAGRIVNFVRNAANDPVVILATGNVDIAGTLSVAGVVGNLAGPSGVAIGGDGGPGGFTGGNGASSTLGLPGTAGKGPAGGAPGASPIGGHGGSYGAPATFETLIPLFGGSGGGGGGAGNAPSGGGGGGAVLIASSTLVHVNGTVSANGGGARSGGIGCANLSGAGTGGAIRIVAPTISGTGSLQAIAGAGTCVSSAQPSAGRIRLEAFDVSFNGGATPIASIANAPGPVSAAGNPSLANVPTLSIVSIGGVTVPTAPAASYFTPDLALAPGTSNPVPVVLAATNTPVGTPTEITVRVIPQAPGTATNIAIPPSDHTGSLASSAATINVTLPVGQVTVLQAFAGMNLTGQTASLFPSIDGEPVQRVLVAATPGAPSTLSLVTRSGREVRVDQLRLEEQAQVARAWQILRETHVE